MSRISRLIIRDAQASRIMEPLQKHPLLVSMFKGRTSPDLQGRQFNIRSWNLNTSTFQDLLYETVIEMFRASTEQIHVKADKAYKRG